MHVNTPSKKQRIEGRYDEKFVAMLDYYAAKESISRNEFMEQACRHYIAWVNDDFDVPTASIQRINQMVDMVSVLESRMKSLEHTVGNGIQSIVQLSRGDNYLAMGDGEHDE